MEIAHFYAQVNTHRRAFAVTQTAGIIEGESVIELPFFDASVIGKTHDAATGAWTEPAPTPEPEPQRRISPLAFRRRFTKTERTGIELAAVDRPELTIEQRMQSAALRSDLKDQAQAMYIDLDDVDVAEGVQVLEVIGLLNTGRALEILTAPVKPGEQP